MPTVEAAFEDVRRHAKKRGVRLRPPCPPAVIDEFVRDVRSELGFTPPDEYIQFLKLSDGLETQSGHVHGAQDFMEYNVTHWCRDFTGSGEGDVYTARFSPKPPSERVPPTFALIGDHGNLEWFVYMLRPPEYRVTNMGFVDEVNGRFQGLGELLLRLARK
jgi:hypothetical protein